MASLRAPSNQGGSTRPHGENLPVFERELEETIGIDSGVVDQGVPCVVAVGELGVVGSVGVGLFDAVAFFVGLADPPLEIVVALGVVLVVGV